MKTHLAVNRLFVNKLLKIMWAGLLSSVISLNTKEAAASSLAAQSPVITTQKVTAGITNLITVQFTTNLSSPTWRTIGTFSGSTNLSFTNLPAVFIRGVCNNLPASATLAWQPSTDPAVTGYKIYYGVASQTFTNAIDVGSATNATISNLTEGVTYYFAATAYDTSGIESPFSSEASGAFQTIFSLIIGSP
jgi:hypothetical protein